MVSGGEEIFDKNQFRLQLAIVIAKFLLDVKRWGWMKFIWGKWSRGGCKQKLLEQELITSESKYLLRDNDNDGSVTCEGCEQGSPLKSNLLVNPSHEKISREYEYDNQAQSEDQDSGSGLDVHAIENVIDAKFVEEEEGAAATI